MNIYLFIDVFGPLIALKSGFVPLKAETVLLDIAAHGNTLILLLL